MGRAMRRAGLVSLLVLTACTGRARTADRGDAAFVAGCPSDSKALLAISPVSVKARVRIDAPGLPPPCQDGEGKPLRVVEFVALDPGGVSARVPVGCEGHVNVSVDQGRYRVQLRTLSTTVAGVLRLRDSVQIGPGALDLGVLAVALMPVSGVVRGRAEQAIFGDITEGSCADVILYEREGRASVFIDVSCSDGRFSGLAPAGIYVVGVSGRPFPWRPMQRPGLASGRMIFNENVELGRAGDGLDLAFDLTRFRGRITDLLLPESPKDSAACLRSSTALLLRPSSTVGDELQVPACDEVFDAWVPAGAYGVLAARRDDQGFETTLPVDGVVQVQTDADVHVLRARGSTVSGIVLLDGAPLHAAAGQGPPARIILDDRTTGRRIVVPALGRTPISYVGRVPSGLYRVTVAASTGVQGVPMAGLVVAGDLALLDNVQDVTRDLDLRPVRVAGSIMINGAPPTPDRCGQGARILFRGRAQENDLRMLDGNCQNGKLVFDGVVNQGLYSIEVAPRAWTGGRGIVVNPQIEIVDHLPGFAFDIPERPFNFEVPSVTCFANSSAMCGDGQHDSFDLAVEDSMRRYRYVFTDLAPGGPQVVTLFPGQYEAVLTLRRCGVHATAQVLSSFRIKGPLDLGGP